MKKFYNPTEQCRNILIWIQWELLFIIAILLLTLFTGCTKPSNQKYAQLTALGSDTIQWQVGNSINQQVVVDWWTMTIPVYAGDTVRLSGKCPIYLTITEGDYVVWIMQCEGCNLEYINN